MTILQAGALRMKWNRLPYPSVCEHRNLELESDDFGYSMGNYVCIVCGESVVVQPKHPFQKENKFDCLHNKRRKKS
jgi:hypothetical protein